jgi:protein TonB
VGITLGSTASGGSFAVGVGNTLYGKAREVASDPSEVKPYAGPSTPPVRLSAQPRLLAQPRVPYPPEARKAGVEGRVLLALAIGRDGAVAAARVLSDPGSGLGEAAREAALRFRFSPALAEGEAVETEIRFTYTFVLE